MDQITTISPKMRDLKLNLGCGLTNKKEGYINIDRDEGVLPDIVVDVEIIPWTWIWMNQTERIEMNNLLEHIENRIGVINECHNILKPGGILWIKVPFIDTETKDLEKLKASILDCFSDWTHTFPPFTTRSFDYCDINHSRWQKFGKSYGIPKFERSQRIKDRFLIVNLKVIK